MSKRPDSSTIEPGQPFRKDGKLIVISLRSGRLANRLTLFAQFIALAEEQGHRIINFAFHSYAHLFETTRRDIYCRYPVAERRSWLDVVPGVAATLRKTRICYQIVCYASIWNESFPVFGKKVVTLREKPGSKVMPLDGPEVTLREKPRSNVIPLDGPEVQAQIRDAWIVFAHGWPFRVPTSWIQRHAGKIRDYFRPIEEYDRASREAVDRLRRGMPAGCRNWPRNFRIAKSPFSFAATNREPRTSFRDYRSDWAPVRRWATSTPWPGVIIFSDPKALLRNGLPFTATSRCFS